MNGKRCVAVGAVLAFVASAAVGQTTVVPNSFTNMAGTSGLNTFIRDLNNPRTGQLLIDSSELAGLSGQLLTGLTFRLWTGATANYPPTDATWTNYDIFLGESVVPTAGTTTFASNVVGSLTQVRSGPLTIPANSFASTGGPPRPFGFEIPISPFLYTGGHLLVEIRHTGSDIVHPAAASYFLDVAGSTATLNRSFTGTGYTATTGALSNFTITRFSYVPAPGTLALLGIGGLLAARRRR